MLVGDKIPLDDYYYYAFLLLLKICSILLSPSITLDTLPYLCVLIEGKISLFKEIYPNSTIIPKMHYMLHYPSQIYMFGPLINTWTMRHESKFSFIKRSSQNGNFKNVPKTVAKTHQLWLAYKLEVDFDRLTEEVFDIGKSTETLLSSEPEALCEKYCFSTANPIVKHSKWVKIQNTFYRLGLFVLLKYQSIYPVFGQISDLVVIEKEVILYVNVYNTSSFHSNFNSYVIFPSVSFNYVKIKDLLIYDTFYSHQSFDKSDKNLYVSLPHYVCV